MSDAAPEIVFTGAAKPPSWVDRAGHFVREKVIAPHTPEAHYQDIMRKYFWVTDRLEGPSLELALRLRPTVELAARAGGWSKTLMEGFYVGQAALFMAFLGYRGLKSASEVFKAMGNIPRPENSAGDVTQGTRDTSLRQQIYVARTLLKGDHASAVMLGDGRILGKEGDRITPLPSHPMFSGVALDEQTYYSRLPLDERRAIEARAALIRQQRKGDSSGRSSNLGKIKMELSEEHRKLMERVYRWFNTHYQSNTREWNASVLQRVRQGIAGSDGASLWNRMLPDAAYTFAKRFWEFVQEVGGTEVYQQRLDALRHQVTSPTIDRFDFIRDAFRKELEAIFPNGDQADRTAFLYELMKMDFPSMDHTSA